MISYLKGRPILEKDFLTIVVNNVGYAVRVTDKVRKKADELSEIELSIYTHVREDLLELYGFSEKAERELFMLLLTVSGVGPKTALAIINMGNTAVVKAVQDANVSLFTAVPRVGKKLGQKIIIELRSKLGALKELDLGPASPKQQEVVLALLSLGFSEESAYQALQSIEVEEMSLSDAVKSGIKILGGQK